MKCSENVYSVLLGFCAVLHIFRQFHTIDTPYTLQYSVYTHSHFYTINSVYSLTQTRDVRCGAVPFHVFSYKALSEQKMTMMMKKKKRV